MKKLISFLTAIIFILGIVACAKDGEVDKDKNQNLPVEDQNVFEGIDLGGEQITIMCLSTTEGTAKINSYSDLKADSLTGDPIVDAVYERNESIKSLLNCELEVYEMGTYGSSGTINVGSDLKNNLLAGNPDGIYAGFVNGISLSPLLSGELLYNLNDICKNCTCGRKTSCSATVEHKVANCLTRNHNAVEYVNNGVERTACGNNAR